MIWMAPIVPPAGWAVDNGVWIAPANRGVELAFERTVDQVGADHVADIARTRVDQLHDIEHRATLAAKVQEEASQEKVDKAAKLVDVTLAWHDTTAQMTETARLVLAFDGSQLVGVTGECIARDDAVPAAIAECKAALATLDPEIASRVAFDLAATAAAPTPPEPPAASNPAPTLSEGSHTPLPPLTIPQDKPGPDRRPVYVGAGIAVLAAVFWWNRRRRAKLQEKTDDR